MKWLAVDFAAGRLPQPNLTGVRNDRLQAFNLPTPRTSMKRPAAPKPEAKTKQVNHPFLTHFSESHVNLHGFTFEPKLRKAS